MFIKKSFVSILLAFSLNLLSAQTPNDASVIIHQNSLNNFLKAVGDLSRTESFNLSGIKGSYKWTVKNPSIQLSTDKASFKADAVIAISPSGIPAVNYQAPAYGDVQVKYDPATNRISVKVLKAAFEIAVTVFGRKIRITEIDLSKYYKLEFEFPGPQPFQSVVDVPLPDGKVRKIQIKAVPVMRIEKDQIVVASRLTYTPQ